MRKTIVKGSWLNVAMASVFAVLLAVTLVFIFNSGAWLVDQNTSKKDGGNAPVIKFGSVELGDNIDMYKTGGDQQSLTIPDLQPAESITYIGSTSRGNIQYIGTLKAFYRISYTVNIETNNEHNVTEEELHDAFTFANATFADKTVVYGELEPNGYISSGSLIFGTNGDDSMFSGITFTLTMKIQVVQATNISGEYIHGNNLMTYSQYQDLFEYIFDN